MLNILSLFSGVGAYEKALENLNIPYNLINYSEINRYASKAYSLIHHVSENKNLGDIRNIDETQLPSNIDIITYSFPCQDISIAGKKEGFFKEDGTKTRSGLFFDALRIINATKPKIAVTENVKNLTSKKMKPVFDLVLNGLDMAGYNNYYQIINANDYGIPQNRKRIFIVSIRKDIDNKSFTFPSPIPLTKCMNDFLDDDDKVPEVFYLSEEKTQKVIIHNNAHPGQICDRVICTTLLARDFCDPKVIKCSQIANLHYYGNDQMNRIYSPRGLCPVLTTASGGGREVKIYNGERYRKLTPTEYFRLMGFSDTDVQILVQNGISKTQLYKMAGNSIVVNVLEYLFKQIYQ